MVNCYNNALQSYQKWFVGNDARAIMLADEDIVEQVGNNIYPLVAAEGTTGDFIIYSRDQYGKKDAKMGVYEDNCQLAVVAISENYDRAISLASKIDNALTGQHVIGEFKIQFRLVDSTETYEDNKYIETLIFQIK